MNVLPGAIRSIKVSFRIFYHPFTFTKMNVFKNSLPVPKSQNLVTPSKLWLMSIFSSGVKIKDVISATWPSNVFKTLPVFISHCLIVRSAPAL